MQGTDKPYFPVWGFLWLFYSLVTAGGIRSYVLWWECHWRVSMPLKGAKEEGRKLKGWSWPKHDMTTKSRPHFLSTVSLQNNPIRRDQRKDQQLKHIISHLSLQRRRPMERLRHLGPVWEVSLQLEFQQPFHLTHYYHHVRKKRPPSHRVMVRKQRAEGGTWDFLQGTQDMVLPLVWLQGCTLGLGASCMSTWPINHQQAFMENYMNQGSFQCRGKRNAAETGLSTK